ncbi:hypothetical protein GH714_001680 [Hevea brasiliensis]|uniref:Protein kinase domain-containing protein n=1 Tax=Hevea brasiliensis TaxID=3981 RepID=A0A6A6KM69_HEVBR|nr:hypothetical protein GH714_001680 [Hevea brasiliensis]
MEAQRVVVIQDASREVSSSALRWALQGLSLMPGDMLTLLSVLRQVETHSETPHARSKKLCVTEESHVQKMTQSSRTEKAEWQAKEIFQNPMCALCKNRRPNFSWQRDFTYAELYDATDGFSSQNSLSEGGIGSAFRCQLKSNNMKIVVKQHRNSSPQGEMDFLSEVDLLMKARHKNVLMLLGSCIEGRMKLLVYEYACNGSVYHHISKHCPLPLTWVERMKVALGAARGLNYLHENNIVYRNMRTCNIVLTHEFEPRLADFGFSWEHNVLENLGYLAPEYPGNRKLSTETDVYAFGVVLLELISGRMVKDKIPGGKVLWDGPLLKERRLLEIVDPRISDSHDAEQLYWMGRVTQNCLSKVPKKRLTMDKVVSALECITERNLGI